jgi:hypothetical protein
MTDFLNTDTNTETEATNQEIDQFTKNHQQPWSEVKDDEKEEGTSPWEGMQPKILQQCSKIHKGSAGTFIKSK